VEGIGRRTEAVITARAGIAPAGVGAGAENGRGGIWGKSGLDEWAQV
jgi:hypothetical protein